MLQYFKKIPNKISTLQSMDQQISARLSYTWPLNNTDTKC